MEIVKDIVTQSFYDIKFEELLEDLVKEIELRNYRITRVYNIDNIKEREELLHGFQVKFENYKIVEFCNLNNCAKLISSHLLAGVFMPVKFIIYQEESQNHVQIAFLKPTAFARIFASIPLTEIAAVLEKDMYHVLEEIDF